MSAAREGGLVGLKVVRRHRNRGPRVQPDLGESRVRLAPTIGYPRQRRRLRWALRPDEPGLELAAHGKIGDGQGDGIAADDDQATRRRVPQAERRIPSRYGAGDAAIREGPDQGTEAADRLWRGCRQGGMRVPPRRSSRAPPGARRSGRGDCRPRRRPAPAAPAGCRCVRRRPAGCQGRRHRPRRPAAAGLHVSSTLAAWAQMSASMHPPDRKPCGSPPSISI